MADEIVLHVTEANYEATVVKSAKPVLLAIGASWCIDCKRIQPMLINKGEILDTLVEPKKVEAFDEFVQKALKEI